jgi:hypothetical protein
LDHHPINRGFSVAMADDRRVKPPRNKMSFNQAAPFDFRRARGTTKTCCSVGWRCREVPGKPGSRDLWGSRSPDSFSGWKTGSLWKHIIYIYIYNYIYTVYKLYIIGMQTHQLWFWGLFPSPMSIFNSPILWSQMCVNLLLFNMISKGLNDIKWIKRVSSESPNRARSYYDPHL